VYQDWVNLLNDSPQGSGAGAVLNTATTATISPVTGLATALQPAVVPGASFPGGFQVGTLFRYTARGFLTTTATSTTATFFLAADKGNNGTFTTLATTAAITTGTTVLTGLQWILMAVSRVTAVATSGNTISTQGELKIQNNATAPTLNAATNGVALLAPMPAASGETAAAIDTTQLNGLALRATLAGANATIQLTQWIVEQLN
jgi:hypothetical protein